MGNLDLYRCEMKEAERVYKIGLFSRINQVTVKTLRHYDEIGLLKPDYIDEENGYRYYTSAQMPILHQILALREIGFTLEEIREVQSGTSERNLLMRKKSELVRRIAEETMKLSKVESYLSKGEEDSEYHVVLKEIPEVIVASMRKILPDYGALFSFMPQMGAEMERLGCECAIPEYCFNIYHDGEYKDHNIDTEMCEAVTEQKEDSDMITFKRIPRVEQAACLLHKGSYNDFPKAYAAIFRFIEENGYEILDHPRESYIDGAWNKDSVDEWLTEIQVPIKKM